MYDIQSFSSLLQAPSVMFPASAPMPLLNGMKGRPNLKQGNLIQPEVTEQVDDTNAHASDLVHQLVVLVAPILATRQTVSPLVVTLGFPSNTYHTYKESASAQLMGKHVVELSNNDAEIDEVEIVEINIARVEVLPMIVSCMIALRKGPDQVSGSFAVLSLGFGTVETGLSTDNGVVTSATSSIPGLHRAVNLVRSQLEKDYDVRLDNLQQLDEAFQEGYIYINSKLIDLRAIRKQALETYYEEVVSPALHSVLNDKSLQIAKRLYLCGGGAYYTDLIACFTAEFAAKAAVHVVDKPELVASKGYLLNSLRFATDALEQAIGLDMGAIATRVATF